VADQHLDFDVEVDGAEVRLLLEQVPPLPARVSVSVASALESKAGQRFSGDSWAFSYPLWQEPSAGAPSDAEHIQFCELEDGGLLLISAQADHIAAQVHRHEAWQDLEDPAKAPGLPLDLTCLDGGARLIWLDGQVVRFTALNEEGTWSNGAHGRW
jgi:hypothetical protein